MWDAGHASWLEVVGGAGRVLITTRNLDVLIARRAAQHSLDAMTVAQARALLAEWTGTKAKNLPDEAVEVADACGRLPIALAMAGALVCRPGGSWQRALGLLRNAKLDKLRGDLPAYPYRNVYQVIEASVGQLAVDGGDTDRQGYVHLAVFAEDDAIPRSAVQVLWGRLGLDKYDVDDLASRLATLALASLEMSTTDGDWYLRLHDIQRAYVRACVSDMAALHADMVDGYRLLCADGLERGPTTDITTEGRAEFFTRLPFHLAASGAVEELHSLLWSHSWLDNKLRSAGAVELFADYERIPCDEPMALLRAALHLSSYVLTRDPDQLPSQLFGRLGYFTAPDRLVDRIGELLSSSDAGVEHDWLRPQVPTLTPPGGPLLRTLSVESRRVYGISLSRNGGFAAFFDEDCCIRILDTHTGLTVCTLPDHQGPARTLALSGNGARLLSVDGQTARLWDVSSGTIVRSWHGRAGAVSACALSGDGSRALLSSRDRMIKVWDTQTGEAVCAFEEPAARGQTVALSRDGRYAVAGFGTRAVAWEVDTGRKLCDLSGHDAKIETVAISDDGELLGAGERNSTIKLWNTRTGERLHTLRGHAEAVSALAVSGDGRWVVSGSRDKTARLWDAHSGEVLRTFSGHSSSVWSVAVSPDGKRVFSGSPDRTVKVWDSRSVPVSADSDGHGSRVWSVALSGDGTRLLSGADDRALKLWDTDTGHLVWSCTRQTARIRSVALSADCRLALSGSKERVARLWDARSGRLLRTLQGHASSVWAVALSLDGKRAVSGSQDWTVKLWNTDSGALIHSYDRHEGAVWSVAISRDGERILSGSQDRTARLWDVPGGALLATFSGHRDRVWSVALSPDGSRALTGSRDHTARLWDTRSGKLIKTFTGHGASVDAVAFSGDGQLALTVSEDKTAKLWDVGTGRSVAAFTADRSVSACALHGAGQPMVWVGDQAGRLHRLQFVAGPSAGTRR